MKLLNLMNIRCCSLESYTVMNNNCNANQYYNILIGINSLLVEQERWFVISSDGIHNVLYLFGLLLQADRFVLKQNICILSDTHSCRCQCDIASVNKHLEIPCITLEVGGTFLKWEKRGYMFTMTFYYAPYRVVQSFFSVAMQPHAAIILYRSLYAYMHVRAANIFLLFTLAITNCTYKLQIPLGWL